MKMRDADGYVWEQRGEGEWYEPKSNSWLPTLDVLDLIFGPLSAVCE